MVAIRSTFSRSIMRIHARSISLGLPSSGLYVLTITDALNAPRIDLLVAAIRPAQAASFKKTFGEAHAQMEQWNEYYQGWPIHDFQRAYLQSLMAGVKARSEDRQAGAAGKLASGVVGPGGLDDTARERAGVTAEPSFFPKPGLFAGDTAVTLRSNVQGIAIHFTVDGSQPVASSPVYGAPIMVKGTELTIKLFASVAGSKDSAVVTGIFRIQE
jgi:hypothetical protein